MMTREKAAKVGRPGRRMKKPTTPRPTRNVKVIFMLIDWVVLSNKPAKEI